MTHDTLFAIRYSITEDAFYASIDGGTEFPLGPAFMSAELRQAIVRSALAKIKGAPLPPGIHIGELCEKYFASGGVVQGEEWTRTLRAVAKGILEAKGLALKGKDRERALSKLMAHPEVVRLAKERLGKQMEISF